MFVALTHFLHSYPFEFNPPKVRRTGSWVNAFCDLGLGGTFESRVKLNPREPGVNATGLFRRKFSLNRDWMNSLCVDSGKSHRIFLVCEGVDSCFSAWVNGRHVGYSQDSCLPAEFDVTDAIMSGNCVEVGSSEHVNEFEHLLALKVLRWCDGSYIEDQDKWWLSKLLVTISLVYLANTFLIGFIVLFILHD